MALLIAASSRRRSRAPRTSAEVADARAPCSARRKHAAGASAVSQLDAGASVVVVVLPGGTVVVVVPLPGTIKKACRGPATTPQPTISPASLIPVATSRLVQGEPAGTRLSRSTGGSPVTSQRTA